MSLHWLFNRVVPIENHNLLFFLYNYLRPIRIYLMLSLLGLLFLLDLPRDGEIKFIVFHNIISVSYTHLTLPTIYSV